MYHPVANTTFSYLLTLDEFRKTFSSDTMPSWVKITTITMISGFSEEVKIDIERIKSLFEEKGSISMKRVDSNTHFEWKLKPSTTFYNQVTLTYADAYSTKSIKIFPNGSIQVAGCADLFDCKRVINQLNCFFKDVLEVPQELPVDNFRVVMINSNFSLNFNVNLSSQRDTLNHITIFSKFLRTRSLLCGENQIQTSRRHEEDYHKYLQYRKSYYYRSRNIERNCLCLQYNQSSHKRMSRYQSVPKCRQRYF